MKQADEIMAQYHLKGGKMLAKTCPACGCPLFEFKGETLCVVCEEERRQKKDDEGEKKQPRGKDEKEEEPRKEKGAHPGVKEAVEETLIALCTRIRDEPDPERVKLLASALKKTAEAREMLD